MNLKNIKKYWDKRSKEFDTQIQATTNSPTIKSLEINALYQAIQKTGLANKKNTEILEVGCGNGHNCFALSELLPNVKFAGLDYSEEMIKSADKTKNKHSQKYPNIKFYVGDALALKKQKDIKDKYDIIFTDRCIINLNSAKLQLTAINQILKKLRSGGYFLMLENSIQNYKNQNKLRTSVGLSTRKPAVYNLFIDEASIIPKIKNKANLIDISDFGSLHDVVLYILTPLVNKGVHDYHHPIVKAAADLSIGSSQFYENTFGNFGQNRLFLFKKK